MSSKECNMLTGNTQKAVRIKGHEFKMFPCGTIVNLNEKSASLGNVFESEDLATKYHPEVLKHTMLSLSTDAKELTSANCKEAAQQLYYFYQTLYKIDTFSQDNEELHDSIVAHGRIIKPDIVNDIEPAFVKAMQDNFNTVKAIEDMTRVFKYLNALLNNVNENPLHKLTSLLKIKSTLLKVATLLGILLETPENFILGMKERYLKQNNISTDEIEELIEKRQEAKSNKDYTLSDELTLKLENKGIMLLDTKYGTQWDIKELYI